MLSDLLGLTIDKGDLNRKSPSPVTSSLKKTATNYLAIGRMAEDLKLIRLNFSRWLAMEGVKVRGTPDMHMLKEDELTKKFGVMREKYFKSKVRLASRDGTSGNKGWAKNLLEKYVSYKISRKIERNIAAAVLKKYKKLTTIRKLVRLQRKVKVFINKVLSKLNIKKMMLDWIKTNYKKLVEPLFKNLLSKFGVSASFKAGLKGAATVALKGFVRMIPFVGWAIVIFEGLYAAWNSPPNSDVFEEFIIGVLDSITLGLVGKDNIKGFTDSFVKWYDNLFMKMFDAVDQSFKFIEEKMTSFVDFIIKKGKSLFTMETRPADFESSFEKWNKQRVQEESKMFEEYSDYFEKMEKAIADKKIKIRQLEVEIASLEYSISAMVKGPEDARLKEAQLEKAKEEAEKTKLEEEAKKTKEGGSVPTLPEKKTPTPKVDVSPTPSKIDGKYEDIKQMIIANEGYRDKPYKDSRGLWTVGIGHLIGDGKKMPIVDPKHPELGMITKDRIFSAKEIRSIFDKDFEEHLTAAEKSPGWDKSNNAGKAGLIDLTYNVGPFWYKKLKDAASLLSDGKFSDAAKELEKTGWYKQVKSRAVATVSLIRSGAMNDKSGAAALASVMSSQKVASAGKFINQESTQVAENQRKQLKPKDVNVAKLDKTNNVKQTNYQNVAMGKDTNPAETVVNRAA